MADSLKIDDDELNVQLAQLERVGALEQGLDCSARGTVEVGRREPEREEERRLFRELFYQHHRARPNVRMQLDFQQLHEQHGYDPDKLEQQLIEWSLDRLVTFFSSRRLRRVRLLKRVAPADTLLKESTRWTWWQQRRLQTMIDYATSESDCRRVIIGRHFGDEEVYCAGRDVMACDVCSAQAAHGRVWPTTW
ncbi:hypothetical protein BZL30_8643 [Mycobacterium kansasii]|uniref:ATP-dependent DNA helicase RecQ zinc-binding domain-containing protein n=1 Tax=Mycobacterium kansasii TaxID=1768 RepID=A0A1V3WFV6_MYCKA|nr:hypothetical protein BZL30_8643 [Mycobacterium kansasii]